MIADEEILREFADIAEASGKPHWATAMRVAVEKIGALRRSATKWISAAQTLPNDDVCVLIALDNGEVWTGFLDGLQWRYVSADPIGTDGCMVTHWAHLPEHPSVK